MREKEVCAELRMDRTPKLRFGEVPLDAFWLSAATEYHIISGMLLQNRHRCPTKVSKSTLF
ncbi:hypothetical protein N1851_014015 [Merluccius polli]|uniref:Uncharacterized protein n=1 Tax=Merluccius polli TaxID=89951 RepID=A0AA47P4S2_MERPO|nr:hypothetical protein N1851_014015 [Merluccius polli]